MNTVPLSYTEHYLSGVPLDQYHPGFFKWIQEIENKVNQTYHLTLLDLPDEDYMVHYESGTTPNAMANMIIKNNRLSI